MKQLIRLGQNTERTEARSTPNGSIEEPRASRCIEQLRHRLVSGNYFDSVEVKTALVGEMLYHCYIELQKRRYL